MIAVVLPCYKVKDKVLSVIEGIGSEVSHIYVVDDACPQNSGSWVKEQCRDPRVRVLTNRENQGVGGATMVGIERALQDGAAVIVKLDGDGQMDPKQISNIAGPVLKGYADYSKGNRFHRLTFLSQMPWLRILGNSVLSFMSKATSGYWHIMDPTNGFFAIHAVAAKELDFSVISKRYFFESDLLYHLHFARAVVMDVPLMATYGSEQSNLRVSYEIVNFGAKHISRLTKRIFYDYFVRDFNVASLELALGSAVLLFALIYGGSHFLDGMRTGIAAENGVRALTMISFLSGLNLLLGFLSFDIAPKNKMPLQKLLS
jgi:dolichol-phosphate mannosyltransferase